MYLDYFTRAETFVDKETRTSMLLSVDMYNKRNDGVLRESADRRLLARRKLSSIGKYYGRHGIDRIFF